MNIIYPKIKLVFIIFILSILITKVSYTKNYAVLFSAGKATSDDLIYNSEYWYDLFTTYESLYENGFDQSSIYVLYGDGTDFASTVSIFQVPSSWGISSITNYSNTPSNLQSVLSYLAGIMTSNDNLYFWWTGHGNVNGSCPNVEYFIQNRNIYVTSQDLAGYINQITNYNKRYISIMTCNSGGIISNLSNNSTIIHTAAACGYNVVSEYIEGHPHSAFSFYIASALNWKTPSGTAINADRNGDGLINLPEAFLYMSMHNNYLNNPISSDPGNIGNNYYTFCAGPIVRNTTINTNFTFTGNVIVNSGQTLTFSSNTSTVFSNGSSLTVNGTLTANGGSVSTPINFNFSGSGGINVSGTSANSSMLSYVTINSGAGITFSNGTTATIKNSTINNCTKAVYIYGSSPQVLNNQILNPSQYGIYIDAAYWQPNIYGNLIKSTNGSFAAIDVADYSVPWIANNKIGGFSYGIYSGGGTVSQLMAPGFISPPQNNLIYGNVFGLTAAYSGEILGAYSNGCGSNNSIYGNTTHDAYSYSSGILYAEDDYWGSSPKWYTDGSALYTTPVLPNDPWGGIEPSIRQKSNLQNGDLVESVTIPNPIISDSSSTDFLAALNLEMKGDVNGAITQYMSMITKDSNADLAITELFKLMKQYSRNDVLTYMGAFSSSNKHYPLVSKLIADNNLQTGQFDNAISAYDNLIKNYPNDYYGITARFQKLFAYLNIKNDKNTSQQILTDIQTLNLTDVQWVSQIQLAEILLGNSGSALSKRQVINSTSNNELQEYSLSDNYPNPFNPSTVINYQLPTTNYVTLKVYDILGREVKTLVNEQQAAGTHSVTFNAEGMASGVYFYQLKAGSFMSTKKMILTK